MQTERPTEVQAGRHAGRLAGDNTDSKTGIRVPREKQARRHAITHIHTGIQRQVDTYSKPNRQAGRETYTTDKCRRRQRHRQDG